VNRSKLVTIRPVPAGDASSFIIHNNSSEIAKFIPEKYVEPLVIVARIKGFEGIDDYVIYLIKDELEMFADTSRDDLDDSFQKYMYDMIIGEKDVPNTWVPSPLHSRYHSRTTKTKAEETSVEDDDTTTEATVVEDTNENEEDDSK
jgi:hypothetical protein